MDIQLVSSFSTTVSVLQWRRKQTAVTQKTYLRRRHLLCFPFLPSEHQFGVLGHVLLHQVIEESFEDVREIFKFSMKRHGEQGGHIGSVSRREGPLALQSVNELRGRDNVSQPRLRTDVLSPYVTVTTLVRNSLLLSRLDSCTRPCSTVCRRHS